MGGQFQSPVRALLLALGIVFLGAALLWPILSKWAGRLPGDIVVRRGTWTFAFPLVTCLVLSLLVSLLIALFRR